MSALIEGGEETASSSNLGGLSDTTGTFDGCSSILGSNACRFFPECVPDLGRREEVFDFLLV